MTSTTHGRTSRSFRRMRSRILEQSDVCWLCGQPGADTVDHIVPLSVAPDLGEVAGNMAPAHRSCNSRKGAQLASLARPLRASRRW
jgi:5-methylcytosine-specific restriction endonuclease McrA